jgi:hypothetical protein
VSQFKGPQPGYKMERAFGNNGPKGSMRLRKAKKRLEAEVRDELLAPDDPRRRAIRLGTAQIDLDKPRKRRRNRKINQIQVSGDNSVQIQVGLNLLLPDEDEKLVLPVKVDKGSDAMV